jgi:hypothetical protein
MQSNDKIVVLDPRGQAPLLRQTAMTPRIDSLDGKTVYVVHMNWPHTSQFSEQLQEVLSERFPNTKFIYKLKMGPYGQDDPQLWSEIHDKGDAAIVGVGH